jgi:hypothetical protein
MSAVDLIQQANEAGIEMRPWGEYLLLRGPGTAVRALKPGITARKSEIIEYLRGVGQMTPSDAVRAAEAIIGARS